MNKLLINVNGRSVGVTLSSIAGAEALKMSLFQLWGLRVLPRGNFQKNIGANMCDLVHFVDEIRIYGVQDRVVHGNSKSHWNVIPMEWE